MNMSPASSPTFDILVVDDTPEQLRLLSKILEAQGYKVRKAINGERALQAVEALHPDLILLDVMMPDMQGYEVCCILKESPETRNIPVIFVSALDDIYDKVLGFNVGAVDYITKPYQIQEVVLRVRTHLNLRKLQNKLQLEIGERKAAQEALEELNQELENKVNQRTMELQISNMHLLKLQAELRKSLTVEQELNQLKDEFLQNISHELLTPLNGMIGFLDIVLEELCDNREEELDLLQKAKKSSLQLQRIIRDILDFSSLRKGETDVEIESVDLHSCLEDAIALWLPQLEQKNLKLIRKYSEISIQVKADYDKLKQVFEHLLENGIKFTDAGSITIKTFTQGEIESQESLESQKAIIMFQDTGIGIAQDDQHKLFQEFVMIDGSSTRRQGGNGLGLVVSQKFIELMGGSLSLVSAGKSLGTTVSVSLPLYGQF
ncbi:MAG: ATP-binding response regulator [Microcoleaceae cyanobacterium]|jgi:signal transduction histidine kinase